MTKGNRDPGDKNNQENKHGLGIFFSFTLANFRSFQDLMQSFRIISHFLLQQWIEEPSKGSKQLKPSRRARNKTLALIGHFKSTMWQNRAKTRGKRTRSQLSLVSITATPSPSELKNVISIPEFCLSAKLKVWTKGGNFVDRVKQQHFNVTLVKLVYCFRGESIFLKSSPEGFPTVISPRYTRNFGAKTFFFSQILFTYCTHISKPLKL